MQVDFSLYINRLYVSAVYVKKNTKKQYLINGCRLDWKQQYMYFNCFRSSEKFFFYVILIKKNGAVKYCAPNITAVCF